MSNLLHRIARLERDRPPEPPEPFGRDIRELRGVWRPGLETMLAAYTFDVVDALQAAMVLRQVESLATFAKPGDTVGDMRDPLAGRFVSFVFRQLGASLKADPDYQPPRLAEDNKTYSVIHEYDLTDAGRAMFARFGVEPKR